MQIPKCTRLALYVGPTGLTWRAPMTDDMEAPASVQMKSGEVRTLVMVQYPELSVEDAFPVVEMGVAHDSPSESDLAAEDAEWDAVFARNPEKLQRLAEQARAVKVAS